MDNSYERAFIQNYEYYIENRLNDTLRAVLSRNININYIQSEIIEMKYELYATMTSIIYTPLEGIVSVMLDALLKAEPAQYVSAVESIFSLKLNVAPALP